MARKETMRDVLKNLQYQTLEDAALNPARVNQAEIAIKDLVAEKIDQADISDQITWLRIEVYNSAMADYSKKLLQLFESSLSSDLRDFLARTYDSSRGEAEEAMKKLTGGRL